MTDDKITCSWKLIGERGDSIVESCEYQMDPDGFNDHSIEIDFSKVAQHSYTIWPPTWEGLDA
jgi:hypothetical protein